jgi:flagellar protein FlbD
MIKLTRLNQMEFYLNPDLIKSIEEKPDTTIKLVNDDNILVREKAAEIVDRIVAFRVRVLRESRLPADCAPPD